jgi:hypothetical protein
MGGVCAGFLLCAVVGCSLDSFLVSVTGRDGQQQVVAGSADEVSARLQAALGRVGIAATINRRGEDVRVVGKTRSGKDFALVLHEQTTSSGRQTAVGIEWQGAAEEGFLLSIMDVVATQPARDRRVPGQN